MYNPVAPASFAQLVISFVGMLTIERDCQLKGEGYKVNEDP